MEITNFSRIRILRIMQDWDLPKDWVDPLYNYLVYGWNPGGFFSKFLANDCWGAMQSSHPNNHIELLKKLAGWTVSSVPREASGSWDRVEAWTKMSETERRTILERYRIIFTQEQEIMAALEGRAIEPEPYFY